MNGGFNPLGLIHAGLGRLSRAGGRASGLSRHGLGYGNLGHGRPLLRLHGRWEPTTTMAKT